MGENVTSESARNSGQGRTATTGTLVLRPAPKNWIRQQAILVWGLTYLTMVPVIGVLVTVESGVAVAVLAAVLGGTALTWASLRAKRIVVTPDEIAQLGLLIRRRAPRARAARIVRAVLIMPRAHHYDTVFVLDAEGRPVIRIYGHVYDRGDVDRLVDFLGLPWTGPPTPVHPPELARVHPGIVPWHQARPVQFALVFTGIAVTFSVLLTVVLQLTLAR
ncbi:MAG TPA: hypothetical protein VI076_04060 [Actinopolymorphaceae bacterium]